jgi:putative (di)nucleoside polyphosphate hydrolase
MPDFTTKAEVAAPPREAGALHRPVEADLPETANRKNEQLEAELVALLSEPEVRLLMHADRVEEDDVLRMLRAVSIQLRRDSEDREDANRASSSIEARYRPGVGVVLLNSKNEVFVGRRGDLLEEAWQLPQGGIEQGETPLVAALRELKEETGIENVEVLAESGRWVYYRVPDELAVKAWDGRWIGQRQKWFVMLFRGWDSEINIDTETPEFDAWRWLPVQDLLDLPASFKRHVYAEIIGEFASIFRD